MEPIRRRATVPGALGTLAATIETPTESPARWALFCHGFGSRKEFKPLAKISRALAGRGWGTMRFDFSGHGDSEGAFAETNFQTQQRDLLQAHDWLAQQWQAPELLIGHSLGGATLLSVGPRLPATHAIAIGAPADTRHLAELLVRLQPALRHGAADVTIAGVPRRITPSMLDALRTTDFSDSLRQLPQQLLVLQPEADDTVVPAQAPRIAELAQQTTVHVLENADHLLSTPASIDAAVSVILDWLDGFRVFVSTARS